MYQKDWVPGLKHGCFNSDKNDLWLQRNVQNICAVFHEVSCSVQLHSLWSGSMTPFSPSDCVTLSSFLVWPLTLAHILMLILVCRYMWDVFTDWILFIICHCSVFSNSRVEQYDEWFVAPLTYRVHCLRYVALTAPALFQLQLIARDPCRFFLLNWGSTFCMGLFAEDWRCCCCDCTSCLHDLSTYFNFDCCHSYSDHHLFHW